MKKPRRQKGNRETREEQLTRVFRTLGDPSRCRILDLLREADELRVGDIAEAFDMSLNGVSKHLKILEEAGLIQRRRDGTSHFLSVRWEGLAPVIHWLDERRHYWEARLDALERRLTEGKR